MRSTHVLQASRMAYVTYFPSLNIDSVHLRDRHITSLSTRRPGVDFWLVRVGFVLGRLALGQAVLLPLLVVSLHQFHILIFHSSANDSI